MIVGGVPSRPLCKKTHIYARFWKVEEDRKIRDAETRIDPDAGGGGLMRSSEYGRTACTSSPHPLSAPARTSFS